MKEKLLREQDTTSRGTNRPGTIVAMGDSLTAGFGVDADQNYPSLLERKLRDNGYEFRVINAGINGEKSGEALARLDRILEVKPDIVILQTGTNDGLRNVPPQEMHGNIDAIAGTLAKQGVTVVLAGMENLKPRKNFLGSGL